MLSLKRARLSPATTSLRKVLVFLLLYFNSGVGAETPLGKIFLDQYGRLPDQFTVVYDLKLTIKNSAPKTEEEINHILDDVRAQQQKAKVSNTEMERNLTNIRQSLAACRADALEAFLPAVAAA